MISKLRHIEHSDEVFKKMFSAGDASYGPMIHVLSHCFEQPTARFIKSTFQQDVEQATDVILQIPGIPDTKLGVRVRDISYYEAYGNEITLRSRVPCGEDTELQKVEKGMIDFMINAFRDEAESIVRYWVVIDAHKLANRLRAGLKGRLFGTAHNDSMGFNLLPIKDCIQWIAFDHKFCPFAIDALKGRMMDPFGQRKEPQGLI